MYEGQMQAAVLRLLGESGIIRANVIDDIKVAVRAGEVDLAFDMLCMWIAEDDLPVSPRFFSEVSELAREFHQEKWIDHLRPLVPEH
jgi:hypothetical protein